MKVSLGLIISEIHLSNIKYVEEKFKLFCNFHYYIVKNNEDIVKMFKDHYEDVDAFVFSGPFVYGILEQELEAIDKPCYIITDDIGNIYKQLLGIFLKHPGLDLSRVYIDFTNEELDREFRSIFPKDKLPYYIPSILEDPVLGSENILKNHLKLWTEKKIDLSITKFGMLIDDLNEAGVKYEFIAPSNKYIEDLFNDVIKKVKLKKINKNKAAVVFIEVLNKGTSNSIDYELELLTLKLLRETIKFTKENDLDFVINRKDQQVEIITTIEEIIKVTENFTSSKLQFFLENKLNKKISIGYGTGENFSQAKENALTALEHAKENIESASAFVSVDQKVLERLESKESISYSQKPNLKIISLAEQLNISNIYLQKIIAYSLKMGRNKISSQELANLLNVTDRTANRTLNRIVHNKGATVSEEKRMSTKGRPTKYYVLDFIDYNGKLL